MKQESLTDKIYRELRSDLMHQVFARNTFLVEKTICERYGCSKATAGEVLHQMCAQGFLESFPRKGYAIVVPDSQEFFRIQRLRYTIESMEIRWVIDHCSDEEIRRAFLSEEQPLNEMTNETFHLTLARMLDDKRLYNIMDSLMGSVLYAYAASPLFTSEDDIGNVHSDIVAAMLDRDYERAMECYRTDIHYTEDSAPMRR